MTEQTSYNWFLCDCVHIYEIVFYVAVNDSLSLMKCFTGYAPFSHSRSAKGARSKTGGRAFVDGRANDV